MVQSHSLHFLSRAAFLAAMAAVLLAAPSGSRAGNVVGFPDDGDFAVSFETTPVGTRDVDGISEGLDLSEAEYDLYELGLAYGLLPNMAIDTGVGMAQFDVDGLGDFGLGPMIAIGARYILAEGTPDNELADGFRLSVGFKHSWAWPDDETVKDVDLASDARWWRLTFEASQAWRQFLFYAGIRYSEFELQSEFDTQGETQRRALEEENVLGAYGGVAYAVLPDLDLFAEVGGPDYALVTLGAAYTFGESYPAHSQELMDKAPRLEEDPEQNYGWVIGLDWESANEIEMDEEGGPVPDGMNDYRISSNRVLAKGGYEFAGDYGTVTPYGVVGGAGFQTNSSGGEQIDYDFGFAWGLGAELEGYTALDGLSVIAGLRWLLFDPDGASAESVRMDGKETGGDPEVEWDEWEISLGLKQELGRIDAFAGIKYVEQTGDIEYHIEDGSESSKLENTNEVRLFTGVDYQLMEWTTVRAQLDFLDERRLTLGIRYQY